MNCIDWKTLIVGPIFDFILSILSPRAKCISIFSCFSRSQTHTHAQLCTQIYAYESEMQINSQECTGTKCLWLTNKFLIALFNRKKEKMLPMDSVRKEKTLDEFNPQTQQWKKRPCHKDNC